THSGDVSDRPSGRLAVRTTFPACLLHSPDFYAGDPYPAYRELRATSPVCWNDVTNFWALLKYEDIRFVSSNPAMFSSTKGVTIPDPRIANPVQEGSLLFTDPPRHRQPPKRINSGFTRRPGRRQTRSPRVPPAGRWPPSSRKPARSCAGSLTASNPTRPTSSPRRS